MNKTHTLIEAAKLILQSGREHGISVLDLGCGSGLYWAEALSNFKIEIITGVDSRSNEDMCIEEEGNSFINTMISIKSTYNKNLSKIEFVQSDVVSFIKNNSDTYNLIVCFQILSLLNKSDAKILLSNLKSVLDTQGLIALCIPSRKFNLKHTSDWPTDIPDSSRNKFNLDEEEFLEFIQGYNIQYLIEKDDYYWAILSCT